MRKMYVIFGVIIVLCINIVCAKNKETQKKETDTKAEVRMTLTSDVFKEGEFIPRQYTCDSVDISPPLTIFDVPEKARSLALICDDPDAPVGIWVHWVAYNIPPDVGQLPEGISTDFKTTIGGDTSVTMMQGTNDFGKFGYGGPCPPPGKAHRYFFKLYALDTMLDFDDKTVREGIVADDLTEKMKGHILAEISLMGKYKR